jgi:hypothetical protein
MKTIVQNKCTYLALIAFSLYLKWVPCGCILCCFPLAIETSKNTSEQVQEGEQTEDMKKPDEKDENKGENEKDVQDKSAEESKDP